MRLTAEPRLPHLAMAPQLPRRQAVPGLAASLPIVGFILLHWPLALWMHAQTPVATLHAVAVFTIGLGWALDRRRPERAVYLAAYIVGAEVLWRMTEARVFYEVAKYGLVALFGLKLLQLRSAKLPGLPLVYLLPLLPSTILTLDNFSLPMAREQISFNLSGPLALTVAALYFWMQKLSLTVLRRSLLALIAPVLGTAAIAAVGIYTQPGLFFGASSSSAASGGFGPNQVAAVLGLGALACYLFIVIDRLEAGLRLLLVPLLVFFIVQSALTFSRGGLYLAGASAIIAIFMLLRTRSSQLKPAIALGFICILAAVVLLPWLTSLTRGALTARFESLYLSGRTDLVRADFLIWRDNALFGVGPGVATASRASLIRRGQAHTEYTRLLAEHGVLGLVSLSAFGLMALQAYRRQSAPIGRGVALALLAWVILYMSVNGMRLSAPAFVFGLACAILTADSRPVLLHSARAAPANSS